MNLRVRPTTTHLCSDGLYSSLSAFLSARLATLRSITKAFVSIELLFISAKRKRSVALNADQGFIEDVRHHFFCPIPLVQSPQNAITVLPFTCTSRPHLEHGMFFITLAFGNSSGSVCPNNSSWRSADIETLICLRLSGPRALRTRSILLDRPSHDHSPSVVAWISPSLSSDHNSMSSNRSKHNWHTQTRQGF